MQSLSPAPVAQGEKVSGRHSFRLSAGQEITPPVEHDLLATAQAPLRFSERHTFVSPQDHPRPVSKTPFCFSVTDQRLQFPPFVVAQFNNVLVGSMRHQFSSSPGCPHSTLITYEMQY
jgi:hypothetical protein